MKSPQNLWFLERDNEISSRSFRIILSSTFTLMLTQHYTELCIDSKAHLQKIQIPSVKLQ